MPWFISPDAKVLHTGDLFVEGAPFIDYSSQGSAVEWTRTIDGVLSSSWDFETVIPGHGKVAKKADLVKFRNSGESMRNRISPMVRDGKSRDEISKVLTSEFGFPSTANGARSVDGLMTELKK